MIVYFDCYSGLSGDMVLGALVDAGVPLEKLRAQLATLPLTGYTIDAQTVNRRGFRGTQVSVQVDARHPQPPRNLNDILKLIGESSLAPLVKERASAVFQRLAAAEAAVHGTDVQQVHFHEVGAVDSIIDVVGAAIGLTELNVRQVYASAVPTGYGMVQCAHGLIPVPGPAVLELLKSVGAPVYRGDVEAELTTPTGAALLATLATFEAPRMSVNAVGYGFGQRELPWPNALRIWVGESAAGTLEDTVCVLETNLDDTTPELLGATMEDLLAAGALDVYFTPIQMKKNRPATKLSIIAPLPLRETLSRMVLERTTSLGIRSCEMRRMVCQRWQETIASPWGPVKVKVKAIGERRQASPEYEDCLRIARERGVPLQDVYEAVRLALTSLYP